MSSPLDRQKRVAAAVLLGLAWVNLPVLLIIFGGWIGFFIFMERSDLRLHFSPSMNLVLGICFYAAGVVVPWLAAWMWWSFNIPKWRIWAVAFTRDWPALEPQAIQAGLIWSERTWLGSFCSKTEIWTREDRRKFADLRRAGGESE